MSTRLFNIPCDEMGSTHVTLLCIRNKYDDCLQKTCAIISFVNSCFFHRTLYFLKRTTDKLDEIYQDEWSKPVISRKTTNNDDIWAFKRKEVWETCPKLASILKDFICLSVYLLAVLGLHCCTQAFSSCRDWGLFFIVVHGLLIVVASLVAEHRL